MSVRQPHPDSTGWTIEVSREELERVVGLCMVCMPVAASGQYVSVGVIDCTTRRWHVEGHDADGWHDVATDPRDPQEPVRIPRYVLDSAQHLDEEASSVLVYRDRLTGAFVARAGDDIVVADPWEDNADEAGDYLDMAYDPALPTVKATITTETLRRICREYGQFFEIAGDRNRAEPPAFTTIEISDGKLRWRSDWTRWNAPAHSGAAAAVTVGEGSVGFLGFLMWRAVHLVFDEKVTIGWNHDMRDTVWLVASDWGISCTVSDELMFRYQWKIDAAFTMAGYETDFDTDLGLEAFTKVGPVKPFTKDGRSVAVTVIDPGPEMADYVRIATLVATVDADIPAVRREIDRLNDVLMGSKLIVRDREVFLMIDFPMQETAEMFLPVITLLELHVERCRGLDEFLPLFADD